MPVSEAQAGYRQPIQSWLHSDFANLATHDFTSTPTLAITPDTEGSSVTFTALNNGNASTFDLDGATGLRITCNNSTDMYGATQTAPAIEAAWADLIPGFTGQQTAFVSIRFTPSERTADYQTMGMTIHGTTRTNADYCLVALQRNSSAGTKITVQQVNTTSVQVADDAEYDMVHFIWRPTQDPMVVWDKWNGVFPDPLSRVDVYRTDIVTALTTAAADLHMGAFAYQPHASNAVATTTLLGLRAGMYI